MTAAEQIKRAEQRAQAERVSHEQTRAHLARVEASLAQADANTAALLAERTAELAETKRVLKELTDAVGAEAAARFGTDSLTAVRRLQKALDIAVKAVAP